MNRVIAQPVLKLVITFQPLWIGLACFESGWPASKWVGRHWNGLSCELDHNVCTLCEDRQTDSQDPWIGSFLSYPNRWLRSSRFTPGFTESSFKASSACSSCQGATFTTYPACIHTSVNEYWWNCSGATADHTFGHVNSDQRLPSPPQWDWGRACMQHHLIITT